MNRFFLVLLSFLPVFLNATSAQNQNSIVQLSSDQIEAIFLKQNLDLIAEKMNIYKAEADIIQAKLWDNPELSIGDVNLWSTKNQREGESEVISPLFGSFARNTQFSVELSQLFQTANKRNKLIRREKVTKEIAIQEFEEVLRGLKVELRKSISEIIYNQSYLQVLENQSGSLEQLVAAYRKQEQLGNVSRSELLRLQSSLLDLENEINDASEELNGHLKTLKTLLYADPSTSIYVIDEKIEMKDPQSLSLANLIQQAFDNRPDINRQKLETKFHKKSLDYEKSLRVPDLTFSATYDRAGGVWKNYIGFGISFNLPILNRNQGAIKSAIISIDQSEYLTQQQQNIAQHEITETLNNYTKAYKFYNKINNNDLLSELDGMLNVYTKNLLNKNISMLEYIDFMDAYKTNKQTILSAKKKVETLFEELQFTTYSDLK